MAETPMPLSRDRRLSAWLERVGSRAAGGRPTAAWAVTASEPPAVGVAPAGLDERLLRFNEASALLGRFEPDRLFEKGEDERVRHLVLSRALPAHAVETFGGKAKWIQLPEARRAAVGRLVNAGALGALLDERPAAADDAYGETLRDVLRGQLPDLAGGQSTAGELRVLKTVVDDLRGVEGLALPDADEVRNRLATSTFLDEYEVLTGHFVGREQELKDLREFLADDKGVYGWGGAVVTGLGGAGKSALVSKFVVDVAAAKLATVVVLDFDRPGIDARDARWLESELARQVGCQFPQVARALREARAQARQTRAAATEQTSSALESLSLDRSSGDLIFQVRDALLGVGAPRMLLVLDTLEEMTTEESRLAVLRWVDSIAEVFGSPAPLKVIMSGRLFDGPLASFKNSYTRLSIDLEELEPEAALGLLNKYGVKRAMAERIVASKLLPRRPLELRLLARLAGGRRFSLAGLERALSGKSGASEEAARALIFQRILNRLKPSLIRHIASPGLVLRYVSTELVRDVLSPALRLAHVTQDEAREALDELAEHTWLVTRDADGRLWHRKDLRRSTLKLMLAVREKQARRISARAAEYFATGAGGPAGQAEAVYHRLLMAGTPAECGEVDLEQVKAAASVIGTDVADLPPPAAALVRFAQDPAVSVADLVLLPDQYFFKAYHSTGEQLVRRREWRLAAALLKRGIARSGLRRAGPTGLSRWEADACFAVGSWKPLSDVRHIATMNASGPFDLVEFADWIYPYALAEPSGTGSAIDRWVKGARAADAAMRAKEPGTIVTRLAAGLVISHAEKRLTKGARENLQTLLRELFKRTRAPLSAVVEQRAILLQLLAGEARVMFPHLSPATLVLRRPHLEALMNVSGSRPIRPHLKACVNKLYGAPAGRLTPKLALTTLDSMQRSRGWGSFEIEPTGDLDEALGCYLRGADYDFRDPVRFALLEAFRTPAAYRILAGIVRAHLDIPLNTLTEPERFVESMRLDAEHALEPYVELVDRSWNLPAFVAAAARARPGSRKLAQVLRAIRRWDAAAWAVLIARFPRLRTARAERARRPAPS